MPALKITETNNVNVGYRSFIVQAHQLDKKSYYSSVNIACLPQELHVNLLSAEIECEVEEIDKDKRLVTTYLNSNCFIWLINKNEIV